MRLTLARRQFEVGKAFVKAASPAAENRTALLFWSFLAQAIASN
jgi:hypothetical protein